MRAFSSGLYIQPPLEELNKCWRALDHASRRKPRNMCVEVEPLPTEEFPEPLTEEPLPRSMRNPLLRGAEEVKLKPGSVLLRKHEVEVATWNRITRTRHGAYPRV